MLQVNNLNFNYGGVQALWDVTITVPANRITCILGRNGVGKTTLLKNLIGINHPSHGSIHLEDRDITRLSANRRAQLGMALVPQGRMIFPKLTVEENLKVGLQARTDGLRKIPDHVYDTFPVLKEMSRRRGGDLSGGQQQQLAIARAMVSHPRVMLLDEPTEGIQPNIIQQIGRVLKQLVEQTGMTIVLVEQYLDFVREYADSFYVMNRGQVVASGNRDQLTSDIIDQYLSV